MRYLFALSPIPIFYLDSFLKPYFEEQMQKYSCSTYAIPHETATLFQYSLAFSNGSLCEKKMCVPMSKMCVR